MRKVFLKLAVTLDGFIEGPNGEVDWCTTNSSSGNDSGASSHFDKLFADIDTIFFGRLSFEAWGKSIFGKLWAVSSLTAQFFLLHMTDKFSRIL